MRLIFYLHIIDVHNGSFFWERVICGIYAKLKPFLTWSQYFTPTI